MPLESSPLFKKQRPLSMPDDPALSFNLQVRLIEWHSVVQTILNEGGPRNKAALVPGKCRADFDPSTLGQRFCRERFRSRVEGNGKKKEIEVIQNGKAIDHWGSCFLESAHYPRFRLPHTRV